MWMREYIPSGNLEGRSKPLLPSSASARQPPCQALSVSWKLENEHKQNMLRCNTLSEYVRHLGEKQPLCDKCFEIKCKLYKGVIDGREALRLQHEATWSSPWEIQQPHLPAPWEACQSPCQCWNRKLQRLPLYRKLCQISWIWHVATRMTCYQKLSFARLHKDSYPFAADQRTIVSLSFSPTSRCSVKETCKLHFLRRGIAITNILQCWTEKPTNDGLHFLRYVVVFLLFLCLHFRSHGIGGRARFGCGKVCCEGAAASLVSDKMHMNILWHHVLSDTNRPL